MSDDSGTTDPQPPAPVEKTLTARGLKTRQNLIEAAEAVFGERGYEHASIAEITQRAGVAQGTFYIYFPDKLTLFVKLVDDLGDQLLETTRVAASGLTHRLEIERALFRAFLGFAAAHRSAYRVMRQAEFVDHAAFKRFYEKMAASYARGLRKGIEAGNLREVDTEFLAYSLMGILDFLGMRYVLWEPNADLDRLVDQAMQLLRHGLEPR